MAANFALYLASLSLASAFSRTFLVFSMPLFFFSSALMPFLVPASISFLIFILAAFLDFSRFTLSACFFRLSSTFAAAAFLRAICFAFFSFALDFVTPTFFCAFSVSAYCTISLTHLFLALILSDFSCFFFLLTDFSVRIAVVCCAAAVLNALTAFLCFIMVFSSFSLDLIISLVSSSFLSGSLDAFTRDSIVARFACCFDFILSNESKAFFASSWFLRATFTLGAVFLDAFSCFKAA